VHPVPEDDQPGEGGRVREAAQPDGEAVQRAAEGPAPGAQPEPPRRQVLPRQRLRPRTRAHHKLPQIRCARRPSHYQFNSAFC
jgi:hypothetical protein